MQVNPLPPMAEDDMTMIKDLFTYLTQPNSAACQKVARFGGKAMLRIEDHVPIMDGQKYICMDPELSLHTTDDCLVYSFGISTDWSFDWEMEGFGCTVFAFDPSINASSTDWQQGAISFLQYGVGAWDHVSDEGWQIRTLDTIVEFLQHSERSIHYLKMDVEFTEFEVLRQQVIRGQQSPLFRNVQQLGVELHITSFLPVWEHVTFYREAYKTFLALQDMGFYPFSYEENFSLEPDVDVPGLDDKLMSAMEVVWLKTQCIGPDGRALTGAGQ
ncbi:uncharacterized protein LOC119107288 [Pollicipes pollicipes]|uniref:uncharacterized protein LOC119107288 n=1 Tax=Pollicipes pollicipes TaxID=41117 RepID=UPI001884B47E|nr:uncharacterized protein LOC119107288 [Pollicipes pollicipes]